MYPIIPIRTLADYITKVQAFESASSEFERIEATAELLQQCAPAIADALDSEWQDSDFNH
jgi:hypothetical protein